MTVSVRSSWVLANGIRTHYSEAGDGGPAVLLLHGAGVGACGDAGFRFMIPALAPHFRVYALDQLSFGLTDTRPHAWPVNGHQSLVDHVAAFVDALCLDQVMIVGNSQGAYVAAKYALDHPEKVGKLFLIGSGTIAQAMGLPMPEATATVYAYDASEKAIRTVLDMIVLDKSTITDELVQMRLATAIRPGAAEAHKAFNEARLRVAKDPNLRQRFEMRGRLPGMTIPTRFIWGKQDTLVPMALGQQLEKLLPNIPFTYIERAGHQTQTDQPELVNRMVIEHFRG